MQSRRDQVQAQSYLLGRLTTALVTGELDTLETPHRRAVTGLFAGLLVAALVAGGFCVYGLFVPGGASGWRRPGVVVVEKETGNRYLYLDGRLRPVLNYASARLLSEDAPRIESVSARSLAGVPHGLPIGIAGAPDALPSRSLAGATWTACAPSTDDPAGRPRTALTLSVGPAPDAVPPAPDGAVPVRAAGDTTAGYLLWAGHRHRITASWVPAVLGLDPAAITVPPAWLDLVPAGPDLGAVAVAGRGTPGPAADGRPTRIGQLFTTGDDRDYVLLADGFSRLSGTGYALLAGDPGTAAAYPDGTVRPTALTPAALARIGTSAQAAPAAGLPLRPPVAADPAGRAWCVASTPGASGRLVAATPVRGVATGVADAGVTRTDRTADMVAVAPGVGGLAVGARPGRPATAAAYYLITDAGMKYPLSGAAAQRLGYAPADATVISPDLLDLLPSGPLLDPAKVAG